MIDELGSEARALLDAAREGMSPDAAAVHRVRVGISVASSSAVAAGTALAVKLGVVAAAVAIVAGVGVYLSRSGEQAAPPRIELASPPEAPPVRAAMQEGAAPSGAGDEQITIELSPTTALPPPPSPTTALPPPTTTTQPPPPTPPTPPTTTPSPTKSAPHAAPSPRAQAAAIAPSPERARTAAPARAGEPPREARTELSREVELVDLAMVALRRGDARAALEAVRRHTVETAGRGQLAEDAAAIEVEALCRLHDPTTHAKLEAFDARFPRSAQRSRLTNQCR
jgi:hypothetical protein